MNNNVKSLENINIKNYNTYKLNCIANKLLKPNNLESLKDIIKNLKLNKEKFMILGKGSNIILPEVYNGTIISLEKFNTINIKEDNILVYSGVTLNKFINECINENLKGLENLYGIPGTLGGAIYQNAGCFGSTISDYLVSVIYLKNNEIYTIKKEECNFEYRNSIFKSNKDMIIISAIFKLEKGSINEMRQSIKEHLAIRTLSQPLEYPNAGSVFRNPSNASAGKLIEDNGLKNYHINDAFISEKHANFIINKGNATSKDILDLINYIKETVYENNKINLELEQEIIK